jgi:hypothetical protein
VLGADLLHAFADTPDLSGALCARAEHRAVFDAAMNRGAALSYERAKTICAQCPPLTPCKAWVESLPRSKRSLGVTAGKIRSARTKSDAA